MTKRHAPLAPEFTEPWRARWYCAPCGHVVAAITEREPGVMYVSEFTASIDVGETGRVVLTVTSVADDLPSTGRWVAWCPRCGILEMPDVPEVAAALRADPQAKAKRAIAPSGKHTV